MGLSKQNLEDTANILDKFRLVPRLLIGLYGYMFYAATTWFMGLPNPTGPQAAFISTIVGAGVFGLPFVASRSGMGTMLGYFLVLGSAVLLLHLLFGEICLRTQEKHRLVGYARLYLGSVAEKIVAASTIIGMLGALLIFIILGGNFLRIALSSYITISNESASLLFWVVLSLFVFRGIQLIARLEFVMNIGLALFALVIFFFDEVIFKVIVLNHNKIVASFLKSST